MIRFLFCLTISVAFFIQQNAHARPTRITPEELQGLLTNPLYAGRVKTKVILLAQKDEKQKREERTKTKDEPTEFDAIDQIDLGTQVYAGSGSDEVALIVFAIVGVAMIVAWVPYMPILAYKAIREGNGGVSSHHTLSLKHEVLLGSFDSFAGTSDKAVARSGYLSGLSYGYFLNKRRDPFTKLGVSVETGGYEVKENISDRNDGAYWFAGPSLLYGDLSNRSLYGRLDLLAGSTFDSNYGLISKANLSCHYLFSPSVSVGLNFSALYLRVKEDRGLISSSHQLGLLLGLGLTTQF